MLFCMLIVHSEYKFLSTALSMFFEIGEQSLVGEIERVRMFPIMACDTVKPLNDILIMHFNSQFPPVVKTARSEVDRTYNSMQAICQQHFTMQFQMFQFVNPDPNIIHNSQAPDPLNDFFLFQ